MSCRSNCSLFLADWRALISGARTRSAQAFRPGTVANQDSHILLYVAFCFYFGLQDLPASATVLICFAEFLLRTYRATKSVLNALSSVRRFHLDARYDLSAFGDVALARWRRALPLTVRDLPSRALALPLRVLEELCRLAQASGQEGITMAAFLAVCFHSLARASTLLARGVGCYDFSRLPTLADLQPRGTGFTLNIKWDKTHQQAGQAFQVPLLPRSASSACPVRALKLLSARVGRFGGRAPLFATPVKLGGEQVLQPLTLRQARVWLKSLLPLLGLPQSQFTLHSLRRGGCTLAYAGGAQVSDLQALGGWASHAVHLYHSQQDARRRAALALHASGTGIPPAT